MWKKPSEMKPVSTGIEPLRAVQTVSPAAFASPSISPAPAASEMARLTPGLRLKGNFSGSGDMTLEGELEGKVRLSGGHVTVGPKGRVVGDIKAREIHVQGTVEGKLDAAKRAVLSRTARVTGDILSPGLVIEEGARFQGRVEIPQEPAGAHTGQGNSEHAEPTNGETPEFHPAQTFTAKDGID